jgi:hypothetical protein
LACADDSGISTEDFGLPSDFKQLLKITKTSKSENEDPFSGNFRDLFRAFKKSNSHSIAILTFWIEYLKANPYSADLGHIKTETNKILNG